MKLADGDALLLQRLYALRFATSGQLARSTGRSSQVIRRRLRKLAEAGFALPLTRSPTEQAAYALAEGGFEWIAHQRSVSVSDLPFSRKISQGKTQSFFWRHELLVGDIVIAFEQALEEHPRLRLPRVIREWELADRRARAHHRRFVLSERFEVHGKAHVHRPDACLILEPKDAGPDLRVAAFVEADRATQPMPRIRRKMDAFFHYWQRERFRSLGASGMRVLFVLGRVTTDARIRSMQSELHQLCGSLEDRDLGEEARAFARLFRFTRSTSLNRDIIRDPVWTWGLEHEPRPFLRPKTTQLMLPFVGPPSSPALASGRRAA